MVKIANGYITIVDLNDGVKYDIQVSTANAVVNDTTGVVTYSCSGYLKSIKGKFTSNISNATIYLYADDTKVAQVNTTSAGLFTFTQDTVSKSTANSLILRYYENNDTTKGLLASYTIPVSHNYNKTYSYIRYSDDGGQTFTAASQAAIDAAKGSLPLDGRNLLDVNSIVKSTNVATINISNATTNTFNILVGTVYNVFRIKNILPFVTDTTKWGIRKYVLSGYIKADVDTTVNFDFGDTQQNEVAINVTTTSTYFAVTFNRTGYLVSPWYGFIDVNLPTTPTANITFSFDKLKLEVGEVATAFSATNIVNIENAEKNSWAGRNIFSKKNFRTVNGAEFNNYLFYATDAKQSAGIQFNTDLFPIGKQSVISCDFTPKSNNITQIGGHSYSYKINQCYIDGKMLTVGNWTGGVSYPFVVNTTYHIVLPLTRVDNIGNSNAYIQPNRGVADTILSSWEITNVKLEYGDTSTPWTPAPEDCTFGTTEGDYMGTLVWDKPYPSNDPKDYTWALIKGDKGDSGPQGADAVTVRLVPDRIVVDTDPNGHVTSAQLTNAYTTVEVKKGATAYDSFTIGTPTSKSSYIGCSVAKPKVKVASIADDPSTEYAYGSGYIDIPVTVDGVVYTVRLTVETNIHKVVATLKQTSTEIGMYVVSVAQAVDSNKTATDARIAAAEGKINTNVTEVSGLKTRMTSVEQTAEGISMTVGEKMLAGNMLTGTMFRREEEVTWNDPSYKGVISTAVQYGETNSVYLESTSETYTWKGVIWRKIPVTAGKKYNMSFWYRTPDAASNSQFMIEVQAFKVDGTKAAVFNPLVNWALPIPANDTWKLYSADMTVGSDVASVNVIISFVTKGKMYIARPMLIEGSYVGWQRSEQDYDYIGGNLLDETKTLTMRGNLTSIIGTVTANAFGVCSSVHANPTTGYTDMLTWRFDYDLNADYTLSFMAKGTGNLDVYLFNDNLDVSLLSEFSGQQRNTTDGNATIVLTPEWKRHTVRWRTKSARTLAWSYLQLRVWAGNDAYIAQPKLEKGCTATAWTDGDGDMVSTKALLATGIDIKDRKVTITSDNVQVKNNSGETTMLLDRDGKIQTNLVVASVIKTGDIGQPHVEAKGSEFKIFGYEAFPFIELAWHEGVGSVLRFNDEKTGQALYDLGPGGILNNIATVPDKWTIMPLKSLTTSSRLSAILDVTENDCTKYNQFVEGYKQVGGKKQYNISGTSSPSSYSGKMYVLQSYNSAVIPDGWYVRVNNGNYPASAIRFMDSSSTLLYMCNLLLVSGGEVTNSAACYFTKVDTRTGNGLRSVGRDKDGNLLGVGYPYLWSYGVEVPMQE